MIIAIDLDDTLADSLTSFIEFHNENYKTLIKFNDFTAYTLNEIIGLPREEEMKRLEAFDNSKYYDKIKPIKGAVEAISELSKKHKIIIITSRPEKFERKTRNWVEKNFHGIKEIFFIRKVYHETARNKAEICKEIGAKLLIDDNLDNVLDCEKAGIQAILIDYPWNQYNPPGKLIKRVKSWKEMINVIEDIDNKLNCSKER